MSTGAERQSIKATSLSKAEKTEFCRRGMIRVAFDGALPSEPGLGTLLDRLEKRP